MSDSLGPPWTVAHQASLSMEFSRQEYWSGLALPALGNLPDPGIKPESPSSPELTGAFFTTSTIWEAHCNQSPNAAIPVGIFSLEPIKIGCKPV